jgi:DNA-binding SARP family transcriptional activator
VGGCTGLGRIACRHSSRAGAKALAGRIVLRICLLGGFHAYHDDRPIVRFAAPKVEALFAYLLVHRSRLWPRSVLADLFWEGLTEASARNSLNTSVSRLRHALADQGARVDCLVVEPGFMGIDDGSRPWLDVAEFELANRTSERADVDEASRADALKRADELYGGALLEGLYDEWCVAQRERLERLHVGILERLMSLARHRGDLDDALRTARKILAVDPLREDVHRTMIKVHFELGDRVAACRQYRQLEDLLRRELGIAPMPETQALWATIAGWPPRPEAALGLTAEIDSALRAIEELQRQLAQTLSAMRATPEASDTPRQRPMPTGALETR